MTAKIKIIEDINNIEAEKVKKAFIELMKTYLMPAFGSISKRDFDILLFMKFQELGVVDANPEIYEIVTDLKVTRAKARNLLYEAKLRKSSKEDLDSELKDLLLHPIIIKDNDKIAIEIENPYLIDHLRFTLKKMNHLTDGSFSPELVKLTTKAYLDLFKTFLPDNSEEKIIKTLVDIGAKGDSSFTGVMTAVLIKLGAKVADKAGGEVAESLVKYLGPILKGNIKGIKTSLSHLFSDPED